MIESIDSVALIVTLAIVAVAGVLQLAYDLLHWPKWLVTHVEKQREGEVRSTLKAIGFTELDRRVVRDGSRRWRIRRAGRETDVAGAAKRLLSESLLTDGPFDVGKSYTKAFSSFIDVQGSSVDPDFAERAASALLSYLRVEDIDLEFDRIIGIKEGSPSLALEVGRRLRVPVCLYRGRSEPKWGGRNGDDPRRLFDGPVSEGENALIVDDSVTGARKALDAIEDLSTLGVTVDHCLVLFEPLGKDGRERLASQGVELLAVITLDPATLEEIRHSP